MLAVVMLFAGSLRSSNLQSILLNRALLYLGFISYPLYLIHCNIMIGTAQWIGQRLDFAAPLLPLAVIIGVSYLVAKYFEPAARAILSPSLRRLEPSLATHSHLSGDERAY